MASQVKKNKNQFLRKGVATSSVRNTLQDANIVDVSTIQSGVERIHIETPDVNSGVQSGVKRVPTDTPILSSGVQSGVERVPVETLILSSDVWSGTKRDQLNIPNVNSGEINGSLRSTHNCAEGVNLDALFKQPATNACTEVSDRSVRSEENSDARGTIHACTMYNQSSEYVPKLHSESCSIPSTDSISQSAVNKFAGQQTYDHVDKNHAPPLPKNPPPELPPQPPRIVKYKTLGQHSSPANRGVNKRSPTLKKQHSSRLQMEFSPQAAHNLADDGEENEVLSWEYPGERNLMGQQLMASEIQYPNLKEHSQMHYEEDGILGDIGQGNQSSKAGHKWQYGEQSGRLLSVHPGGRMQQMQGVLYMGNIENMHPSGREFGYTPSWQEERCSGQFQDGQHGKGFLMHTMEHATTRRLEGAMEPGPNIHQAGTIGPGPTRHYAGAMRPGSNMHHAGTMWPGPNMHHAGTMGPGPNMHHAETMGPGPNMHHAGTMDPGPYMHHAATMGPGPTRHDAGFMGPGPSSHYAGAMGPRLNMHHAGTMGQMPYQMNEGSGKQMHGSSMGQMYGGSVGQMHPYAQSEAMNSFGQEYMKEFQDVYEHDDMGQSWNFPETWQGYSQGNACYSPGASSFPGPSTYITDRELASGHLDQRMNNPWFQKLVQNMKELVEREGLVVKDVFPDGNCLFTAVIDQLRVRGNFNFTPSTLRAAAVAFLRENPKQHDGTHLEQFLMNESWDHYLSRMGKDGEWGEHIILGAMSEVLKCRIIVLGGMSGNSSTVVQPQRMSDEEEKKMQKEKEANGSEIVKDEPLAGTAKSEAAESKSLQTGAASSTSKADAKTKGTDISHAKDQTSSLSKQNTTKKDEALQMGEDLYIGLVGEMHYVSLRKKDWEERLNEKLRARIQKRKAKHRQEAGQIDDSSSDDDLCLPEDLVRKTLKSNERRGQEGNKNADNESSNSVLDSVSLLPLPYLNFLLDLVISEEYITHQDSRTAPTVSIYSFDAEISSLSQSMLDPCVRRRTFTTRHLMGGSNIRSKKRKRKIYFTRNDSKAAFTWRNTLKDADFVISEETSEPGYLRLVPVKPDVWEGCHLALVEDTIYLKQSIASSKPFTSLSLITCTATIGFSCLWPSKAEELISRKRLNNVPSSADIERIVALGCKIVPATIGNDLEWEYSFHTNERLFFTGIVTKEQRNLLLLLTSIIDHLHDLDNIEYDDILTSVYLYACEEIPNKTWLENPSFCFCKIIEMILDGLRAKFLPNYFMRCKNILKGRSHMDLERLLEPLEILRSNPLSCLHFLFDGYGYSGTEFGIIFNAVICDFHAVGSETEITQRFEKFVTNFPQRKSDMRNPDQDVYRNEGMTRVPHGMNSCQVLSLFDKIFASFEHVKMWCALLTMSRLMGQPLMQLIGYQHESVNSVEIFGPDFTALFGGIQIPKTYSYGINMVCFVCSFADLIFFIWPLDKAMAVGLRYFLLHKAHETQCVLPDLNNLCFFSVQEQSMSIMIFLSLYVVYVTDLYRQLYNVAVRLHETDLLVDMIGPLECFCCLIGTQSQYEVLADFYQLIGDDNKARQARSRALCA